MVDPFPYSSHATGVDAELIHSLDHRQGGAWPAAQDDRWRPELSHFPFFARRLLDAGQSLANWDGVYFSRIAECGYEYEQFQAFFPLLPLLSRHISRPLVAYAHIPPSVALVISGVLLSNVCFVLSALVLYRLGMVVLNNERLARLAALLYCITPASIFMSAMYTESMFALLVFTGHLLLEHNFHMLAAFVVALAGCTRSNSMVYVLFFVYRFLQRNAQQFFPRPDEKTQFLVLIRNLVWLAAQCSVILLPLLYYEYRNYVRYCSGLADDGTSLRPWCDQLLPSVYNYVQRAYWNNGFLNYFTVQQLPNFLLATPMLLLVTLTVIHYARQLHAMLFMQSGPVGHAASVYVYVVHVTLLTALCFFFMHVQVLTRFVAACPVIYWYVASSNSTVQRVYIVYALAYLVVGSTLFSTFYPWT